MSYQRGNSGPGIVVAARFTPTERRHLLAYAKAHPGRTLSACIRTLVALGLHAEAETERATRRAFRRRRGQRKAARKSRIVKHARGLRRLNDGRSAI